MNKLVIKEIPHKIISILEFFNPEYFSVINSLLLNSLIKNNCAVTKNINGNISKMKIGEFKKAKRRVK
tara:strand:+ start:137 stop:340 length:204 start_codon:yes stop_codon:yes gene_type:complete